MTTEWEKSSSRVEEIDPTATPVSLTQVTPPELEQNVDIQDITNPPSEYLTSWKLVVVTICLALGTFLMALDVNIIGVAVPTISSTFHSLDDVGWYGSAYLLAVTAFQPVFGYFYKYFSVKTTYLLSIILFEVGSTVCAAASSSPVFIVGRAIAGLGAAGLFQGALGIIGLIVELERRPLFMGIVISVFGVSVCLGPVVGGVFTDRISWRWCFWINVPIGVAVVSILIFLLKIKSVEDKLRKLPLKEKYKHMDLLGATVFIGAICCLVLALQWGGQTIPWSSSKIIGLMVGFGVLSIGFGFIQYKRGDDALIPFRVLRQRSILMGSCYLMFLGMVNFMYGFYLQFYFQAVQEVSTIASGVRIIPLFLSQIVSLIITGAVVTKWGYYVPYMILGQSISLIGSGLITTLDVGTSTVKWVVYLIVTGLGMGMGMQLPYTAVLVVLSESDTATGNAISVFANQLGGVISIPVGQAILLNSLRKEVPRLTSAVSANEVIRAGPSALGALADSRQTLLALQKVYAISLANTYIFALVAGSVALLFTFGMEWKSLKKVAKARENQATTVTGP